MKIHSILAFSCCCLCFSLILLSCHSSNPHTQQNHPEQAVMDSLENQIIQLHDSLMGKIDELRQTSATMQHLRDSLHLHDATWNRVIDQLSLADSAMFTWMAQFDLNKDTAQPALRKQYLLDQLAYIQRVKDSTYLALDSAKLLMTHTER